MFELDDDFLSKVGLGSMPPAEREEFLKFVYSELELRVGSALSEGLSHGEMQEFEDIIDRDGEVIVRWLEANVPDFLDRSDFNHLRDGAPSGTDAADLLAEYAALKWIELQRPDYRSVVKQELDRISEEILAKRNVLVDDPPSDAASDGTHEG